MYLVEFFQTSEVECKCGCGFGSQIGDMDWCVINSLNELRINIGHPIIVNSACRCKEHNKSVGGAENSYHTMGRAVDIYCPRIDLYALAWFAKAIPLFENGGIGIYRTKGFIHLDNGHRRRWYE